jgi:putative ABC transport system permease protein
LLSELVARARSLWRGVSRSRQVDADLKDEFQLHMDLRAADLVKTGMTPEEALRKARAEFGIVENHIEGTRHARGLKWFDETRFSWLDLKLGTRMLVKYPVLTIVGGFSMAFAILTGAGTFEAIRQIVFPQIPLPDANRIVMLQNWDASANTAEPRATHDFITWRSAMRSVEDLSAFRTVTRNLTITEGLAEPVYGAEISASGFRVLRVQPILGRTLTASDENASAPRVAVIGHHLWQDRFNGDSSVIGRSVKLNGIPATIVGVMPERFAFPATQELWVPLNLDASRAERRQGLAIKMFGRLAPGASIEQARTELAALGQRAAMDSPDTHQHLRTQLFTFAASVRMFDDAEDFWWLLSGNIWVALLLILVCGNVGLLMLARAATRETEIIVRTALGASRRRIVMQMFAEALVLGGLAAVVGLTTAAWGVPWGLELMRSQITDASGNFAFWIDGKLSPMTFVYAVLLTLLAAVFAGALPGLRITRDLGNRLKSATPGGGGTHFGGMWTVLMVLQLAVTMGFPVGMYYTRRDGNKLEKTRMMFPVDQFLSVRLEMERYETQEGADTSRAAFFARYIAAAEKLETRLASEPEVTGIVFAEHLPRQYHPNNQVEVDDGAVPAQDERGHRVGSSNVDAKYLDVLGVSMLSGRWFTNGEALSGARVAVVNKSFVDRVMGGGNPIGKRVRYVWEPEPHPWYEIIGVVPDVGINSGWGPAGIYRPLDRASMYPINVAIRMQGDPKLFAPRLRSIATDIDASLRTMDVMPLKDVVNGDVKFMEFWVKMTTIVSAMVLVLSLVSIYAVMSFAVSRKTREIGVRVALGGNRWRIVTAVFAHPLRQLGMGLVAGMALVWLLQGGTDNGWPTPTQILTLVAYTASMAVVFMIACVVPTWRALAVQPTEALRDY